MGARGGGGGKRGVQRAAAAAAAATRSRRSRRGCSSPSPTRHYTYAFLRPPFPRLDTRLFFPTAMVRCKAEEEREVVKKKRGKRCEGEKRRRSDRIFFFPFFFWFGLLTLLFSPSLSYLLFLSLLSLFPFPFHPNSKRADNSKSNSQPCLHRMSDSWSTTYCSPSGVSIWSPAHLK